MRTSSYQEAKPSLLSWKEGRWILELEMLVPLGWGVWRPVVRHVEGREGIVYQLEKMGARQLVEPTVRVIEGSGTDGDDRAYEMRDGRWAPSGRRVGPLRLTSGAITTGASLVDPEHEIKRLNMRVGLLEVMVQGGGNVQQLQRIVAKLVDANEQLREKLSAIEARLKGGAVFEGGADARPDPFGADVLDAPAVPLVIGIFKSPSAEELTKALEQLIDGASFEVATKGLPEFGADKPALYICTIIDASDAVVGALITDVKAAVYLGGRSIMMPDEALEELLASGAPTDDVRDALGQVLIALGAVLNQVPGNPPVRTNAARQVDYFEDDWLFDPLARADFGDSFGGRLVILAKEAKEPVATGREPELQAEAAAEPSADAPPAADAGAPAEAEPTAEAGAAAEAEPVAEAAPVTDAAQSEPGATAEPTPAEPSSAEAAPADAPEGEP